MYLDDCMHYMQYLFSSSFVSDFSRTYLLLCISTAHTIYLCNTVDIFLACANAHMAKVNNRNLEVPNYSNNMQLVPILRWYHSRYTTQQTDSVAIFDVHENYKNPNWRDYCNAIPYQAHCGITEWVRGPVCVKGQLTSVRNPVSYLHHS